MFSEEFISGFLAIGRKVLTTFNLKSLSDKLENFKCVCFKRHLSTSYKDDLIEFVEYYEALQNVYILSTRNRSLKHLCNCLLICGFHDIENHNEICCAGYFFSAKAIIFIY